jgi:Zn-dependent protease
MVVAPAFEAKANSMFGQVPPTAYDLRFQLLGIPVRVHPVFWLTSAFLAWDQQNSDVRVMVVRILCIFVAILVHEMGHALMNKIFGFHSEIVLYFFGGYATSTRHSTWRDIAVSAAGPGAGFLLYFGIYALARVWITSGWFFENRETNFLLANAIDFSLFINLAWNAMNLVPVIPLDGGQICRELCLWFSRARGMEICLIISTVAAAGLAAWSIMARINHTGVLGLDPTFLIFMFGYLALQSYQQYEQVRRGYW